ncbi:hypothetical protein E3O06_02630 [Cryobacterium glaciale]|uniref:Plastocyanin-like domain-containing protein n=1 Tax=Cryobacterium glaciale TaxID=1259145 RepID=A0A4R8V2T7_9MICO|nr:hypothetical protein E3O06_02630 [Cryobacterium glaciale]
MEPGRFDSLAGVQRWGARLAGGALAPDGPMRTIEPGETLKYSFTATRSGIWLYHCSTMPSVVPPGVSWSFRRTDCGQLDLELPLISPGS